MGRHRGREHDPSIGRRKETRHREAVAAAIVDDPHDVGSFILNGKRAIGAGVGRGVGRVCGDRSSVAVDQHRGRQPLERLGGENSAKHVGGGQFRGRLERRVEFAGENGRAHADLMRRVPQRGLPLVAQMLKREKDCGDYRGGDRQKSQRRSP